MLTVVKVRIEHKSVPIILSTEPYKSKMKSLNSRCVFIGEARTKTGNELVTKKETLNIFFNQNHNLNVLKFSIQR